jgi:CheY-like chemotaxis protein
MNAKIIRVILEKNDFIVETASNGKIALDMVTGNHAKYNLILMVCTSHILDIML